MNPFYEYICFIAKNIYSDISIQYLKNILVPEITEVGKYLL